MRFVPRSEWGARAPRSRTRLSASAVTIHWAGTPSGEPGHDQCDNVVRAFQAYHMDTHGWADLAYNAVVCAHGYVYEGRGREVRSAANGTNEGNGSSFAICYLLGTGEPFTQEGKNAINDAAEWLVEGGRDWYVHRNWLPTGCPGDVIAEWVAAGHPRFDEAPPAPEPEPAPVPCEEKVFGLGDEDRCVFYIQRLLNKRGFGLVDDGVFGPKTERAVIRFQKNHRLRADGIVGARTWASLWWGQTL